LKARKLKMRDPSKRENWKWGPILHTLRTR